MLDYQILELELNNNKKMEHKKSLSKLENHPGESNERATLLNLIQNVFYFEHRNKVTSRSLTEGATLPTGSKQEEKVSTECTKQRVFLQQCVEQLE